MSDDPLLMPPLPPVERAGGEPIAPEVPAASGPPSADPGLATAASRPPLVSEPGQAGDVSGAAPAPPLPPLDAVPVATPQDRIATTGDTASTRHPRSPQKRLQAQQQSVRSTVRSQPLAPQPAARAVVAPRPDSVLGRGSQRRWHWPLTVLAALAWAAALLLVTTNAGAALGMLGSPRRVFVLGWLVASLLTFAPLQWRLSLSGLTWQGVLGWTLSAFLLAWSPPPAANLLSLPEVPAYLLLFLAIFYAVAATVTPVAFLLGQRVFRQRVHRLDARRARRQGYEAGLLAVSVLALANVTFLRWWTALLLVIVFVLLETLFLSQVRPEG